MFFLIYRIFAYITLENTQKVSQNFLPHSNYSQNLIKIFQKSSNITLKFTKIVSKFKNRDCGIPKASLRMKLLSKSYRQIKAFIKAWLAMALKYAKNMKGKGTKTFLSRLLLNTRKVSPRSLPRLPKAWGFLNYVTINEVEISVRNINFRNVIIKREATCRSWVGFVKEISEN